MACWRTSSVFFPPWSSFEFLGVLLHDAEHNVFRLYAFGGTVLHRAELENGIPVPLSSAAVILRDQKAIVINDIEKETRFADIVETGALLRSSVDVPPPSHVSTTAARRTGHWDHSAERL